MSFFYKLVILLQIGGGFWGFAASLPALFGDNTPSEKSIVGIFVIIFFFGIVSGFLLFDRSRKGLACSLVYQFIQIPTIATPTVVYRFYSGFDFSVYTPGADYVWLASVGYAWRFAINNDVESFYGINLLAFILFIILLVKLISSRAEVNPVNRNGEMTLSTR